MTLPNGQTAIVDIRKLREYCLNEHSPQGRNKARVFKSVLGLTLEDSEVLQEALLRAASSEVCELGETDIYGRRFTIRFEMQTTRGNGWIHSAWIIRHGEVSPRLTTCFVMKRR